MRTKRLPPGNYVYMRGLPADANDESVAEWLRQWLPLTADFVSVQQNATGTGSTALICIPKEAAVKLLRHMFLAVRYPGHPVDVTFSIFGNPTLPCKENPPHVPASVEVTEENWAEQI
jgi:hypothetical protein